MSSSVLLAALAVLAPAGPESPQQVATKLAKEYAKAIKNRDSSYFEKNSTKDFVYVSPQGQKQPRAQALAQMKAGLSAMKQVVKSESKVLSARRAEGGLVFRSESVLVAMMEMGPKKLSKMESHMIDETLVVPVGKAWHYKRVKMIKDDTKIDGKPMSM